MIKLRNLMAGFGAGLIVASVTLQLASSSGGARELVESATGAVQLDENNVKKWAEENGYQLIKKEEKAASALQPSPSQAAKPAVDPAADPAASPSASPSIGPAASPGAKASSNNAAKPAASTPAAPSAAVASTPSAAPVSSPASSTQLPLQTPEVSPPAPPSEPKSVTIPGGASSTQIGEILADAGIVDKTAFDEALRQAQATTRIRSGTYSFMPGEDPQNIIDELTKVPKFQ